MFIGKNMDSLFDPLQIQFYLIDIVYQFFSITLKSGVRRKLIFRHKSQPFTIKVGETKIHSEMKKKELGKRGAV